MILKIDSFLMALVLLGSAAAQAQSAEVTLEFTCEMSEDDTNLRFAVGNAGDAGTTVILGTVIDDRYLPHTLVLEVIFSEGAEVEEFSYVDPVFDFIAGKIGPWIVPLPVGAEYTLGSALHFWSGGEIPGPPFRARFRLEKYVSSIDISPVYEIFTGDAFSDWIEIPTDCGSGKRPLP